MSRRSCASDSKSSVGSRVPAESVVAFAKSALVEESRGLGGATKSKLDLIIGNLGNQYETLLNKQAKLPGDPYA